MADLETKVPALIFIGKYGPDSRSRRQEDEAQKAGKPI